MVGGTGLVGAKLVSVLRGRALDPVIAARSTGVDTLTGAGLRDVMTGAKIVIDVINSPSLQPKAAQSFFEVSTNNVVEAAEAAHVKHYVVLSIVGTDRMLSTGYFRGKMAQETRIERSLIPHSILRTTQFFEFLPTIAENQADVRSVRVPTAYTQPIAADEVAAALADLAQGAPRNSMLEQAGPQEFRLDDVVQRAMHAARDFRMVVTDPLFRYFGAILNDDTLTPDEGAIVGVTRFEDWLKSTASSSFSENTYSPRSRRTDDREMCES